MVLQWQRPYPGKGLPQLSVDVAAVGRVIGKQPPPATCAVAGPTALRNAFAKTADKPIDWRLIYMLLTNR